MVKFRSDCSVLCIINWLCKYPDMEPNILIYEFKVTHQKSLLIIDSNSLIIFSIIKCQGLIAR